MRTFLRRKEAEYSIDITPLMDIVFQLLLFFVLTSAFLQPGLELELPGSRQERDGSEADVVVSVNEGGRVFMNGAELGLEDLEQKLSSLALEKPALSVVLQGDRRTAYGDFFPVLDTVKNAGIKTVSLAHEVVEE
jgi:biopolymer transport protein ExbD